MKQYQQATVRVRGTGNSKQRAFASALSSVQREVLKNSSNVILRIEPQDVSVVEATEKLTTEKFLFFFLPRQKAHYSVTLDVTVELCFVDLNQIDFKSL